MEDKIVETARVVSRILIGVAIVGAWLYATLTGSPAAEQLSNAAGIILAIYFAGEAAVRRIANGNGR